jgi:hypothetical protein
MDHQGQQLVYRHGRSAGVLHLYTILLSIKTPSPSMSVRPSICIHEGVETVSLGARIFLGSRKPKSG